MACAFALIYQAVLRIDLDAAFMFPVDPPGRGVISARMGEPLEYRK